MDLQQLYTQLCLQAAQIIIQIIDNLATLHDAIAYVAANIVM